MPLIDIWKATKDSVLKMNLEATVRIAGDAISIKEYLIKMDS